MPPRYWLLLSFLSWIGFYPAWAQEDHLVPADGYFFSYPFQADYYPKVRTMLYAGLSNAPLARVVVLPSFTPEYVLTVERQQKQTYLVYRICQPSLWSTLGSGMNAGKQPVVKTTRLEISAELAASLASLFNAAIAQTSYPKPVKTWRSDGTTFIFSAFQAGIGLRGGQTWSPTMGTTMSALEAVVNELQQLATAAAANRDLLTKTLINQATKLTAELQAH